MKKISDSRVVITSTAVSVLDVGINLVIAVLTGSTVMLSQVLQGASDLITGGILMIGVRRSKKNPDEHFQFGYGREIFFSVLIAGIIMFIGTGVLSAYFGYQKIINPDGIDHVWLALAALLFGLCTNGYAFSLSLKRISESREADSLSWWRYLLHSSIVETKATLLIDFLGTTAAFIGLLSLVSYAIFGNGRLDGIGSLMIGLMMMGGALLLLKNVGDLIVGRSASPEVTSRIKQKVLSLKYIEAVLDMRTMYLGSEKLLVIVEVHVRDGLDTDQIESVTDQVKEVVHKVEPLAHHVQVEIETPD